MKKLSYSKLVVVGIFAAAMAFVEAAVVIYLRKIYYPGGFAFPLKGFVHPEILNIEWFREFFTIVMLATVAILAAKKFYERFAYFLYSFAVWDIFYYVWLKLTLDWPASFLMWDILFLIPLPWIGPVLVPVLLSLTMILLALTIVFFCDKGKKVYLNFKEWFLLIAGSVIILFTFMYDYGKLIIQGGFAGDFFTLTRNQEFISAVESFIPVYYNWLVFAFGEILILLGIFMFYFRMRK